jgi:L-ribulose-5-phosphate 4-epimerase
MGHGFGGGVKEREGVIKYGLEFRESSPIPFTTLREINAWRKVLHTMRLIGQDPARYGGFGYGNVSQRFEPAADVKRQGSFVISGTQTGGFPDLTERHYALVRACYPERNMVVAEGPVRPSSEALLHGMLYHLDETLRFGMHVHSAHIWLNARKLGLFITRQDVPCGTPEMAEEVGRLFRETSVGQVGIFAMGGHEDGIVSFGCSAEEAGCVIVKCLAKSFQL